MISKTTSTCYNLSDNAFTGAPILEGTVDVQCKLP